jgi:hypothetical protein
MTELPVMEVAAMAAYAAFAFSSVDRLGEMPPWTALPPDARADWRAVADAVQSVIALRSRQGNSVTDEETLAEMRRQYQFATLEAHILVDGVLYLRCTRCKVRPVPHGWSFIQACDECLAEGPRP